ncbi:MAG: hypothetical protein RDU20_14095 [Desulfomonilaceae bacterium]|nr:hypothetical protein [Desulfomonilaceae bacterium]
MGLVRKMTDPSNENERLSRGTALLERIPALAISGEDEAVDLILYEVLHFLVDEVEADIGQINLLPRGGRVEKVCVVKDGRPWLKKGMEMHPFNPHQGFTGRVVSAGESILVEDIWQPGTDEEPNPFLEMPDKMNRRYVEEIKVPVAGTIIAPIKRGRDIFCTLELARYRDRVPFESSHKRCVDAFARRYGALIMDYILDVKNRIAVNTAHKKLLSLNRMIASDSPVDYTDAVEAYIRLSAADIGLVFFKTPEPGVSNYRVVVWKNEEIRQVYLQDFQPSEDSILLDGPAVSFPVEGGEGDLRLERFRRRIIGMDLSDTDRGNLLECVDAVRSYVAYPLHMLGQDLGAVVLGSRRPCFGKFLHMNPFLSLYNSLLRSFLLNERVIHNLAGIRMKIHNPGFYCLVALKGTLASRHSQAYNDPDVMRAVDGLERLMEELHDCGKDLRCREKKIDLFKWLNAFIDQKSAQLPGLIIQLDSRASPHDNGLIRASEEQLETIFENLFSNSLRAIGSRLRKDFGLIGRIELVLRLDDGNVKLRFADNGSSYATVSGRGTAQINSAVRMLGGSMTRRHNPYRVFLEFPAVGNELS